MSSQESPLGKSPTEQDLHFLLWLAGAVTLQSSNSPDSLQSKMLLDGTSEPTFSQGRRLTSSGSVATLQTLPQTFHLMCYDHTPVNRPQGPDYCPGDVPRRKHPLFLPRPVKPGMLSTSSVRKNGCFFPLVFVLTYIKSTELSRLLGKKLRTDGCTATLPNPLLCKLQLQRDTDGEKISRAKLQESAFSVSWVLWNKPLTLDCFQGLTVKVI